MTYKSVCQPWRTAKKIHAVLTRLAEGGHKASLTNLQYCQPQIENMGGIIAQGTKAIAPSPLEGISKASQPQTVGQMVTFFGQVWIRVED